MSLGPEHSPAPRSETAKGPLHPQEAQGPAGEADRKGLMTREALGLQWGCRSVGGSPPGGRGIQQAEKGMERAGVPLDVGSVCKLIDEVF